MSVRIGSFPDRISAELARTRLSSEGIRAHVLEPAGFNPMLNDAAGGVQLQVGVRDLARATAILDEPLREIEDDETDATPVVRCPECELEYCFLEKPRLSGLAPGAVGALVLVTSAVLRLGRKRWRCHKCDYVWDNPADGPKHRTKAAPGDPVPVFLLRRTSAGMGLFMGLIIGFAGLALRSQVGTVLLVAGPIAGWLFGRGLVRYVCSEPTCRVPLAPLATTCEKCGGHVAGSIDRSRQHYREVARFRREAVRRIPKLKKKKSGSSLRERAPK